MSAHVAISELIDVFRSGLLALIPVAERSGIVWNGRTYDPWEEIEQTLFTSFVTSAVANLVPTPPRLLPKYGLSYQNYADLSFISERTRRMRGECLVLKNLITVQEPFDTGSFCVVDAAFMFADSTIDIPLSDVTFELAARFNHGVEYMEVVDYLE
jgi:hypothetical protein